MLESRTLLSARTRKQVFTLTAVCMKCCKQSTTRAADLACMAYCAIVCLQSAWKCTIAECCVPVTKDGSLTVTLFSKAYPLFVIVRVYLAQTTTIGGGTG